MKALLTALLLLAALAAYYVLLRPESNGLPVQTNRPVAAPGKLIESQNYSITSTATDPQTKLVADAADSLFNAYLAFFATTLHVDPNRQKLKLTLYRDQREFKKHNRSSAWAEAYYLPPTCYAYYADGEQNPYHWMIHEATHQLNHEVAHLPKSKWVDEGLATYFGTSKIKDGALTPGIIDANTYPIWWLPRLSLTGDLQENIRSGKLISLRALISGVGGPNIANNVNSYYIGYWSLTYFLFHFENGRYADGYRQVISSGGTVENFERLVGPVEQIQNEWYGYLRQQLEDMDREDVVYIIDDSSTVPAQEP
jgi:hypothetical protein